MAVDAKILSPMPRKALETPHSLPTSPIPSEMSIRELTSSRPFWYDVESPTNRSRADDEASRELRELLSCKTPMKMLPDWMPAFDALSSASTCATSPPPPSGTTSPPPPSSSPPSSPDRAFVRSDLSDGFGSPEYDQQPQCLPGAVDKSSWLQLRKVFVGGIPQCVDQNGLYQMFSKVGKVKKAWLQLFHTDRGEGQQPKIKKHRGFGFVVFYETRSIDQLLGKDSSRFVSFGDNLKLEVKRAVGKNSMPSLEETPSPAKSKKSSSPACPQSGQSAARGPSQMLQQCSVPTPLERGSEVSGSATSPAPQQPWLSVPVAPQS